MAILLASANNLQAALYRAVILKELGRMNANNVQQIADNIGGLVAQDGLTVDRTFASYYQNTGFFAFPSTHSTYVPPYVAVRTTTGQVLTFIGGLVQARFGPDIKRGLYDPDWYVTGPGSASVGRPYWFAAETIYTAIGSLWRSNPTAIFCGYSFGAATGWWLAGKTQGQATVPTRLALVAFGAPKASGGDTYAGINLPEQTHWFNSDDAVPFVPPRLSQSQRWWAGLTSSQGQVLNGYRQMRGGIQIGLTGELAALAEPAFAGDPWAAIETWVQQADAGLMTSHDLEVYITRLRLAGASLPATVDNGYEYDTAEGGTGGGGSNEPEAPSPQLNSPITATQLSRVQAQVQQTYFEAADRQATSSPTIPTYRAFTVQRFGRTYYVLFNQTVVAIGASKKGARALARKGNSFLRSLQTRPQVNTNSLGETFIDYLSFATDPTSGFQPVMLDDTLQG
jgi:hypothetical protein